MATHRLIVLARSPRPAVPGSGPYEASINDLAIEVDTAVGRCVPVAAWLKPRFPDGCVVHVQLRPHDGDDVLIDKPRSKNGQILCPVGVPVGWFAAGGHGVPAIRLLRVVLRVLGLVGTNFGLGPPPLRSRTAADPFAPPAARPSPYAGLESLARDAGPGRFVVAAVGAEDERRAEILDALGTIEATSRGPGKGVRTWTVRGHS